MTDRYDPETGLPLDKTYLECGLPDDLDEALRAMKASWAIVDSEGYDINWADAHSEFIARINSCEVEGEITREQAVYKMILIERKRRILDYRLSTARA